MAVHVPIAATRQVTGVPTERLAVWWLIASEIVIFGGLLAAYLMYRTTYEHWGLYASHTNTAAGAANTFVLLTSSLFAVLAHDAALRKEGTKAFAYLWLTIGGGLTFLVIKSLEWANEIALGYTISKNTFWSFYYTAAGLHGLHVIAGMICMAFVSFDALQGKNLQRVELIGIYWHFVDVVWIFLFPLLYIAK